MKAMVYHEYGSPDVLKLEEVQKPTPTDNQLLIKVYAVSINRSDWERLTGKPLYARIGGFIKPNNKIQGSDIAGRVDELGKDGKQVKTRDQVFRVMLSYGGGFEEYA